MDLVKMYTKDLLIQLRVGGIKSQNEIICIYIFVTFCIFFYILYLTISFCNITVCFLDVY